MYKALISAPLIDSNTFFIEGTGTIIKDSYSGGFNSYTNWGIDCDTITITNHNFPRNDLAIEYFYFCEYAFDLPKSVISMSKCTNYNVGDAIPLIQSLTVTIDNIINSPWNNDAESDNGSDELMFYGKGDNHIYDMYQQGMFASKQSFGLSSGSGVVVPGEEGEEPVYDYNGFTAEILQHLKNNVGKTAKFRIEIKTIPTLRLLLSYTPLGERYVNIAILEHHAYACTKYNDEFNPITVALPANQQCTLSCYMRADDYNVSYEKIQFPITLTEDLTTKTINFVQSTS